MTNIYFPRFAKDGTDRAMRILSDEKAAGYRAQYHVYYKRNGKCFVDPAFRATPQGAIKFMEDAIKELRWKNVEILGVVSTVPVAGMEYPRDVPDRH